MLAVPTRGLTDGARVTLTLTGFRPGEKVFFSECAAGQKPSPLVGCGQQAAAEPFTITNGYGARAGSVFRVSARLHGQRCRSSCEIAAIGVGELVTVHIRFR